MSTNLKYSPKSNCVHQRKLGAGIGVKNIFIL